ncbi:hypothetical protein [Rhodococcus globerulus]|uniref:SMODS-associating 2TM beta-strand rich effector domain-containing protein n=1 Tax=Rhodococcus globerulus TaxID=33008 RepID=A0ABU4C4C1_RHOGO|nr:hypothetical protein [Rhodococcus globerulus]MDV6271121.1 hypothetical protein [Rhodococcus globerulus]
MIEFRAWLAESVKFAVAIFVFIVFEKIAPTFNALYVDVLKQAALALIAGAITFGLFDVILGRPTVELRWCIRDEVVATGTPELVIAPGARQILQLQLHGVGRPGLATWICKLSEKRPMEVAIVLRPQNLVTMTKQQFNDTVHVTPHKIVFERATGVHTGMNDSIEIAFRKRIDGAAMAAPLEFSTTLRTTAPTKIPFGKLVKTGSSIDGFIVRAA